MKIEHDQYWPILSQILLDVRAPTRGHVDAQFGGITAEPTLTLSGMNCAAPTPRSKQRLVKNVFRGDTIMTVRMLTFVGALAVIVLRVVLLSPVQAAWADTTTTTTPSATSTTTTTPSTTTPSATTTTTTTTTATAPQPGSAKAADSDANYLGDRVVFWGPILGTLVEGNQTTTNACLPAKTPLYGIGQDTDTVTFRIISTCYVSDYFSGNCDAPSDRRTRCDGQAIADGATFTMARSEMAKTVPSRYGAAWGMLVVPFKFQLTGAHQLTGSATVGPYLGYRSQLTPAVGITFAGFAGVSNISVSKVKNKTDATTTSLSRPRATDSSNTTTDTEQVAGFSYGVAALGAFKGQFQAGVVLGFDSVGSGSGFQYNNKPWLAVEIGYNFSQ